MSPICHRWRACRSAAVRFSPETVRASWHRDKSLRLLNALNSEDRGLKVRFSLAMIVFKTFELILCQMLSSQGKNAPSNPYPHYLVRLATSRMLWNFWWNFAAPCSSGNEARKCPELCTTNFTPFFKRRLQPQMPDFMAIFTLQTFVLNKFNKAPDFCKHPL